jgi:hypothetical protein
MKRGYLFIVLLFTVFMFPFVGNVSDVDALGKYGCFNPDKKTHVSCLRGLLDSTPYGLTVSKGKNGLGKYGCLDKDKRMHTRCLRSLLDQHGPHLAKGENQPVLPPPVKPSMVTFPMGDPCMAVTDPNDLQVCRASHQRPNPSMPPMGAHNVMPPKGKPGMPPMGAHNVMPPKGKPGMPPMGAHNVMPPEVAPGS